MSDNNTNSHFDSLIGEHDHKLWKAGVLSQVASAIASIVTFTMLNINHYNDDSLSTYKGRAPGSKSKKRK